MVAPFRAANSPEEWYRQCDWIGCRGLLHECGAKVTQTLDWIGCQGLLHECGSKVTQTLDGIGCQGLLQTRDAKPKLL